MWITTILLSSLISAVYTDDVRLPPTILEGPKSDIYREAEKLTMTCRAYGIPAVDYEWKKNNINLNENAYNIRRTVDGSFEFTELTSLDEGYYQCFARNQFGLAMSNMSFLQKAVSPTSQSGEVSTMTVNEGEPFHIQMRPVKTVPPPTYYWEMAIDSVDKYPQALVLSNRVQISDNGDLHFAYAIPEDEIGGKIYKCAAYNEYVDLRAGGSYTSVTVRRGTQGKFAPTLGFASPAVTVAVEGRTVSLRCFYSGNPVPTVEWRGPKNTLPLGRYELQNFNSRLLIKNVQPTDQGDYTCIGANDNGRNQQILQMMVEAEPRFLSMADQPRDTNITEGLSITFNCKTYAKPEANIVWYRNGKVIDVNNPPKRFVISSDKKTLTIQNLCRNCDDRADSSLTDLVIIQCNASNAHGYVFGAGYVNVLTKTNVLLLTDATRVEVKRDEERLIEFGCTATSDPLTPVTPRWYKEDRNGLQLVYPEPPNVQVKDGTFSVYVKPNGTDDWTKYHGTYKCMANNTYSADFKIAEIILENYVPPGPAVAGFETYWWILLLLLLILLIIIIIICCCWCCYRNKGDNYDVDEKEKKNGNDPEKELKVNGFHDYQRPEGQTLRGSRGSLGSAGKLNSDDEASLMEYADDPGKFTEDGSFVGAYATNTTERGRGRRE